VVLLFKIIHVHVLNIDRREKDQFIWITGGQIRLTSGKKM